MVLNGVYNDFNIFESVFIERICPFEKIYFWYLFAVIANTLSQIDAYFEKDWNNRPAVSIIFNVHPGSLEVHT